jgi:hypothetical protein
LHRQREWDAIATLEAPGVPGDECWLVVLPGDRVLVEAGSAPADGPHLARALRLEPPFRAHAVRRTQHWAVAARHIEVVELEIDVAGDEIELVWDGTERSVRVDGEPTLAGVPELERLGAARHDAFVVTAGRLDDRVWEVAVSAL